MSDLTCPHCNESLYLEPTNNGSGIIDNRPGYLEDVPCCVPYCGHLMHTACAFELLAEDEFAECPICQSEISEEEIYPVHLRTPATFNSSSGSAESVTEPSSSEGSGDALPNPSVAVQASRKLRAFSSAFGESGGSNNVSDFGPPAPKQGRKDSVPAAQPANPSLTDSEVILDWLSRVFENANNLNIENLVSQDQRRRFSEHTEKIKQALRTAATLVSAVGPAQTIARIIARNPNPDEGFYRRVANTLVNLYLELEPGSVVEYLQKIAEWLDKQEW